MKHLVLVILILSGAALAADKAPKLDQTTEVRILRLQRDIAKVRTQKLDITAQYRLMLERDQNYRQCVLQEETKQQELDGLLKSLGKPGFRLNDDMLIYEPVEKGK